MVRGKGMHYVYGVLIRIEIQTFFLDVFLLYFSFTNLVQFCVLCIVQILNKHLITKNVSKWF